VLKAKPPEPGVVSSNLAAPTLIKDDIDGDYRPASGARPVKEFINKLTDEEAGC
jgi:hypothetical protein